MNNILKLTVLLVLLFIILPTAYPHSGRTDAQGGHTNKSTGEYHFHNRPESKPSSALDDAVIETYSSVVSKRTERRPQQISVYREAKERFTGKYHINEMVTLYNSADTCFALYEVATLKNALILFVNGTKVKILDVSPGSYKIKIREYVGWIPESVVINN